MLHLHRTISSLVNANDIRKTENALVVENIISVI